MKTGHLPQAIILGTHRTVSHLLGITAARTALHAIEAGQAGEEVFAAIGDDWDVEERARAWLDRLGLDLALDDRVQRLSRGETVLAALAALFLRHRNRDRTVAGPPSTTTRRPDPPQNRENHPLGRHGGTSSRL